jgi:hypothetical protein
MAFNLGQMDVIDRNGALSSPETDFKHFVLGNTGPNQNEVREIYGREIIPRFAG